MPNVQSIGRRSLTSYRVRRSFFSMNMITKLSSKGQLVIPKATRDRLKWEAGVELEVVERAGEVVLRTALAARPHLTLSEFYARLPKTDLSPLSDDALAMAISEARGIRARRVLDSDQNA